MATTASCFAECSEKAGGVNRRPKVGSEVVGASRVGGLSPTPARSASKGRTRPPFSDPAGTCHARPPTGRAALLASAEAALAFLSWRLLKLRFSIRVASRSRFGSAPEGREKLAQGQGNAS